MYPVKMMVRAATPSPAKLFTKQRLELRIRRKQSYQRHPRIRLPGSWCRNAIKNMTPRSFPAHSGAQIPWKPYIMMFRSQNTDLQRDALTAAGVDPRNLFEDKASGAKDDRPGLKAALDFLAQGDVLVVWKLDRLGRSLSHLIEVVDSLKEKHVAFKSLTEALDTTTASGELLFHAFGALAQFERSLISERVTAGLDAARSRGRVGGRPRAISSEQLSAIMEAVDSGMSKAAICRTFGVKGTTLIETLARLGR